MSKQIKYHTLCNGCIFLGEEDCFLSKKNYKAQNSMTLIDGMCRFKRHEKWLGDMPTHEAIDKIISEEKISVSICHNSSIEQLTSCIKSIQDHVEDIVVVVQNSNDCGDISNILKNTGKLYRIENLLDDEKVPLEIQSGYGTNWSKENWVLVINSDKVMSEKEWKFINSCFDDPYADFVCIKLDNNSFVANKHSFQKMEGNLEKLWHEKLQLFENYNEIIKVMNV